MKAIVADAHRLGRRVAAHAHGAEGVRWASEAGVDSVEHGHPMDDASIATLKKNGTYLVPTPFLGEYMEKNLDRSDVPEFSKAKMRAVAVAMQQAAGKAFAAGVKVAFGADAAGGQYAQQMEMAKQMGMDVAMKPIEQEVVNPDLRRITMVIPLMSMGGMPSLSSMPDMENMPKNMPPMPGAAMKSQQVKGSMTMEYYDVNAPIDIPVPDCLKKK